MTETFVDLTYRGLPLGRRIKLTRVRPTHGYLEHPTPMPVGTAVAITTDDGLVFDAVVEAVHEQVAGTPVANAPAAPGMRVKPVFANDQLAGWWAQRSEPEPAPPPPAERSAPITVRPRSKTTPEPITTETADSPPAPAAPLPIHTIPGTLMAPVPAVFDLIQPPPKRGGAPTSAMPAADQHLLQQLTQESGEIEALTRRTGEHEIVDDGMRTTVMDAVDPAALGLDISMLSSESGSMAADDDDEPDSGTSQPIPTQGDDKKKPGGSKKRKKRR